MEYIEWAVSERIATIILNRAEKRNALHPKMVSELLEALHQIEKNENAKVVIIKANGEAFCAGADLSYLQQLQKNTFDENLEDSQHLKKLFKTIYDFPKVVIAQVEGAALAGGCGLANVCDFCFATPESKFGFTEVKIGFIPALVSVFLVLKIGEAKAKNLLLSGNIISANEAAECGLITKIVEKESIADFVKDKCNQLILQASGQSLALTKNLISATQHLSIDDALELAANQNAIARATDDCKKGISSFLNKEKINW
jgi:methylglutaconyl-CoA hydratase